jgi:hypothetical protein
MTDITDRLDPVIRILTEHGMAKSAQAVFDARAEINRLRAEIDRLKATLTLANDINANLRAINDRRYAALEKIRDDHYPPSDLQLRDCEQPEMIWQSVARRALAATPGGGKATK